MNNITIELCQEDRNRLDTLIAIGLELCKKNVYEVEQPAPTEAHQNAAETENNQAPETAHPVDAPDVWNELEGQGSLDEVVPAATGKLGDKGNEKLFSAVQQKVVKLSAAGKETKAAVREVVQKYATKVSDIPAEEYDTVMDQLAALEG